MKDTKKTQKEPILSSDMSLANELSMRAMQLRNKSRDEWKQANEHLRVMGTLITEMHAVHVELAQILKKLSK